MSLSTVTAVIPGTGSVSAGVQLAAQGLIGVYFPGNFANAPLSFLVSLDNTNWLTLIDQYGNEVAIPSSAGQQVGLDPDDFVGYTNIKVRSGTSDNPVTQPSDAAVALITEGTVPPPEPPENARRTLRAEAPGYMGQWPAMLATKEGDVITADLTDCLDVGETISAITSFALSVVGPYGVTDATPEARSLDAPGISDGMVSQRFGNWQALPRILYRVDIQVETSTGNSPEFYGYLPVNELPN